MSANPALVFTPSSEYLNAERDGNIRHEYVHGRVYADVIERKKMENGVILEWDYSPERFL
jgi:hypothetical protein